MSFNELPLTISTVDSTPISFLSLMGIPSSRRQNILKINKNSHRDVYQKPRTYLGVGFPFAEQWRVTFLPSCIVVSVDDSSSDMSGGY